MTVPNPGESLSGDLRIVLSSNVSEGPQITRFPIGMENISGVRLECCSFSRYSV